MLPNQYDDRERRAFDEMIREKCNQTIDDRDRVIREQACEISHLKASIRWLQEEIQKLERKK